MSTYPQPFEWLGLLKWSLSYSDGTKTDQNRSPMSAEDRAFLEEVMKNGIVDEAARMKVILSEITEYLDHLSASYETSHLDEEKEENIESLLIELKDIVGLIDYAKMFAAMGGISFLIGMSLEQSISWRLKATCMTALATLGQNNPTVQKTIFDQGNLPVLMNLYFSYNSNSGEESDGILRSRIVQAISAMVRGLDMAEEAFCLHEKARELIESGLGMSDQSPLILRKKVLFFLQALITSDSSNDSRVSQFHSAIRFIARNFADPEKEPDLEVREMSLSFLVRLYEHHLGSRLDDDIKLFLRDLASRRIGTLIEARDEMDQEELNLCQQLLDCMASARHTESHAHTSPSASASFPMMLTAASDPSHETIPQ